MTQRPPLAAKLLCNTLDLVAGASWKFAKLVFCSSSSKAKRVLDLICVDVANSGLSDLSVARCLSLSLALTVKKAQKFALNVKRIRSGLLTRSNVAT